MTETIVEIGGVRLRGVELDRGRTVLFQHGLGGSAEQVAAHMPRSPDFRRLTLECRAHGASQPGVRRPFSIALFASDALAYCDLRGADRFVAGGISMGAAIALRLAVKQPERVEALVIGRPAWLYSDAPSNLDPYAEAAALLARNPGNAGARFKASDTGTMLARTAPDNLVSLLDILDRPEAALLADLLRDIAASGPGVTRGPG